MNLLENDDQNKVARKLRKNSCPSAGEEGGSLRLVPEIRQSHENSSINKTTFTQMGKGVHTSHNE